MAFQSEIKIFTKNTLIVALFFALAFELGWEYIAPMLGIETRAVSNESTFQRADPHYLGNTATALSIALGQKGTPNTLTQNQLGNDIITISEVLSRPSDNQKRLIGWHMQAIQTYVNLLETDIPGILDTSTNRAASLDEHIALLKHYGMRTNDRMLILDEQIADLRSIIRKNTEDTTIAKNTLQASLSSLDYDGVDSAIDTYTRTRNSDTHARIYLIYLERFRESYLKLQEKNKKLLTVLSDNRDALIKRAVIVVPPTGSDILKELWLIQSQAAARARESLD